MWHRKPTSAVTFYPLKKDDLKKMIDGFFKNVDDPVGGDLFAVISPHAGYPFSGPVAAYSYKELKQTKADVVVVLAPSHKAFFDGASVIPEGIYETPLGNVTIDSEIGNKLLGSKYFGFAKEAHEFEHSLEVQVPFLQRIFTKFKIVPIVIGTNNFEICKSMAKTISDIISLDNRKVVMVISTDLSHYHVYNSAISIDKKFIAALNTMDEFTVKEAIDSREAEICGEGPVLTGMMVCKRLGANFVEILKYLNSGDTSGDKNQVVGYLSAGFYK